jgi:hypothetical protein
MASAANVQNSASNAESSIILNVTVLIDDAFELILTNLWLELAHGAINMA